MQMTEDGKVAYRLEVNVSEETGGTWEFTIYSPEGFVDDGREWEFVGNIRGYPTEQDAYNAGIDMARNLEDVWELYFEKKHAQTESDKAVAFIRGLDNVAFSQELYEAMMEKIGKWSTTRSELTDNPLDRALGRTVSTGRQIVIMPNMHDSVEHEE